jgi:hypothetical protein
MRFANLVFNAPWKVVPLTEAGVGVREVEAPFSPHTLSGIFSEKTLHPSAAVLKTNPEEGG